MKHRFQARWLGFALMLAGSAYLWVTNAVPLLALPQNMVNGTSNFVLLAVPFFIFAGLIMERGGISLRLVRLVHALVGHWRVGLLQVMVGSMYLVSGLSGAMLIFYLATVSVGTVVDLTIGAQVIIAAVMGGRRTILGAALGSVLLIIGNELLRPIGQLATFCVSATALIMILFFPGGFLGRLLRPEGRE